MAINEDFGELRSLLQLHTLNHTQRLRVFNLMKNTWQIDPQTHQNVWLEYIKGFQHHFDQPLVELHNLEQLKQAVEIAPHAHFSVNLNGQVKPKQQSKEFATTSATSQITQLTLTNFNPKQISNIVNQTHHLSELRICGQRLGIFSSDNVAKHIAMSQKLQNLKHLEFNFYPLENKGAARIASSPYLHHLTKLRFVQCGITEHGIVKLAQSATMSNLNSLHFEKCQHIGQGAQAIAQSIYMSQLCELTLLNAHVSKEGAHAIAQSPYLKHLRSLRIFTDEVGKNAIKNSPYIQQSQ